LITEPSDEIKIVGKKLEQWRNGLLIRVVDLVASEKLTELVSIGGEIINELFLEVSMPGQNVSMTQVREQTNGSIIVDFSSGTQLEFSNWEAVGSIADDLDSTSVFAEKILLGKAYRASPDGTNKTTQVGASVSVNLLANEPIVHTRAGQ